MVNDNYAIVVYLCFEGPTWKLGEYDTQFWWEEIDDLDWIPRAFLKPSIRKEMKDTWIDMFCYSLCIFLNVIFGLSYVKHIYVFDHWLKKI